MNENTIIIQVPLIDYTENVEIRATHNALIDVAMASAKLGYDEEHLRFDDELLNVIFEAVAPYAYKSKLKTLQEEKVRERITVETENGPAEV